MSTARFVFKTAKYEDKRDQRRPDGDGKRRDKRFGDTCETA
jgi:hypothetical protein